MKIIELSKYAPGMMQAEALAEAEKCGLRLLTNREADAIIQGKLLCNGYDCKHNKYTGLTYECMKMDVKL